MNSELTDITLVVDRSGSMSQIKSEAENGINRFLESQSSLPGQALLTLVQFDTQYEFVHSAVPIEDVPRYELEPRNATALLDAVGRAINETGIRLAGMAECDRPGLVVFVVMTDGHENSSVEFSKARINSMINHQQTKYNWQFVFLGADQDAFREGGNMGIARGGIADFDRTQVGSALRCTDALIGRMRAQSRGGKTVMNEFTELEREDMKKSK